MRNIVVKRPTVTTSSIDGGGLHTSSANYTMDSSIGGIAGTTAKTGVPSRSPENFRDEGWRAES
jgi:hypothetical protein